VSGLKISQVSKSYNLEQVLDDINFRVPKGDIVVLLGPSGCGKSTLLSLIAGIEVPDEGEIFWNDKLIDGIPPHERGFGLMFQDHLLFPHRNVRDNVSFGLQMAHWKEDKISQRVSDVLELVGLPEFTEREIDTLSGGEGQRVALARALAPFPKLLMLDEPLGSLDRILRERLAADLKKILKSSSQTALYVTHDHEEAYMIADQIIVMNRGRVEQIGDPETIYRYPESTFVARFLGLTNLIPGTIITELDKSYVKTNIGQFQIMNGKNGPVTMLLRPDSMQLVSEPDSQISGLVEELTFRGYTYQVVVKTNNQRLEFHFPSRIDLPQPGEKIHLQFSSQDAIITYPSKVTT